MSLRDQILEDNKNVFMNPDDFGQLFFNVRTTENINVIFDNAFAVIIEDVESSAPAITVADVDIPGVRHNDIFTDLESSISYKVIGIQPDGTGITLLILTEN